MAAVLDLPLDPQRKLILVTMADNANSTGLCWPAQATIARRSSISTRALRDHLHGLESAGWLTILSLGNGRGNSTRYMLNVARIKAEAEVSVKAAKAEDDDTKAEDGALKAEDTFRRTVILEPSDLEPLLDSTRAREKSALDWYLALNHRAPPNETSRQTVLSLDVAHPVTCLAAAFEASAEKDDPWRYAMVILKACPSEGHEPRERSGHGKHIRAHSGRPATGAAISRGGLGATGVDPAFDKYVDE